MDKEQKEPSKFTVADIEDYPEPNKNYSESHIQEKRPFLTRKRFVIMCAVIAVTLGIGGMAWLLTRPDAPNASNSTQEIKRFGVAVGLVEGTAEYSTDGQSWQELSADTDLQEGYQVRTARDSRAVLLIDDGSAVRLDGNSLITLTSLETTNVVIAHTSGQIYNRVVASESRKYAVQVADETYVAKGTAYRTINQSEKQGVEVYHSTVNATKTNTDVTEGKYLLTKSGKEATEGKVLKLNIETLKKDDFISWNSKQDKKDDLFAKQLGILSELDKPAQPKSDPKPEPTPQPDSGITLSGSQSGYTAVFSWTYNNVDVTQGYKLVRSSTTNTPTYPDNSVAYIDANATSYKLTVGDGKTYYYRICAYRGDSCVSYSNAVTVATDKKEIEKVQPGDVTISMAGSKVSWSFTGTAPHGFKVLAGTVSGPTYKNSYKTYYTGDKSYTLPGKDFTDGTTYYIKVCKYTGSGCTDYSNELVYTP